MSSIAYLEKAGFGNHILYKMCADFPLHEDPDVVGGKLWLIGRAYSAAVERKAGKDFSWAPLKGALIASSIDADIAACKNIARVDDDNLKLVVAAHSRLTAIFKASTGLHKRSLASKYLHFHAPSAFFIYDSIASRNVSSLVKGKRGQFRQKHESDRGYEEFCRRCLTYRAVLEGSANASVSPRYVDARLLGYQSGI